MNLIYPFKSPYSENVIFHRFHQLDKGMAQKWLKTPALLKKIFVKIKVIIS